MSSCSDSDEEATMEEAAVTTTFAFQESPDVFVSKSRSLRADGVASSEEEEEEEEEEEAECIESPVIEFSLGGISYQASRRGGSRGQSTEQLRRKLLYKDEKVENEKEIRRLLEEHKEQKYARQSSGWRKKPCMAHVACASWDAAPKASIRCFGCKEYGCPVFMCDECDAMIHSVGDNHKRERILEGNNGFGAAPALALKRPPLIQPECTGCGKVKQGGETTKLVSVRIGTLSSGNIEVVS